MISPQEIRSIAASQGVSARVIEKDYHLGVMLRAIARSKESAQFVFKGGTALKKCYFDEYRFSEDIDFTVISRELNDQRVLTGLMKAWCANCNTSFGKNGGRC